jgi:hypothetical protein
MAWRSSVAEFPETDAICDWRRRRLLNFGVPDRYARTADFQVFRYAEELMDNQRIAERI